jgi:hypothetical protein
MTYKSKALTALFIQVFGYLFIGFSSLSSIHSSLLAILEYSSFFLLSLLYGYWGFRSKTVIGTLLVFFAIFIIIFVAVVSIWGHAIDCSTDPTSYCLSG